MNDDPIVYCYPFEANAYVKKNASLWRSMGYTVEACWRGLWRDRKLARRRKIVVLNWFEDIMLQSRRPKLLSLAWACAQILYFRLAARQLIWVRHNFKSHAEQRASAAHRLLVRFLRLMATTTVSHRAVGQFSSQVVPHVLVAAPDDVARERDCEFLWFGMVRAYKALDVLLRAWPREHPLRILGRSNDEALTRQLLAIIEERQLTVDWQNRYIPDEELDQALLRTKYVVMSHEEASMIVSGVFYHAIALGANILIRDSEFARDNAVRHPFVHVFGDGALATAMRQLDYVAPPAVVAAAQAAYGDAVCRQAWGRIFSEK